MCKYSNNLLMLHYLFLFFIFMNVFCILLVFGLVKIDLGVKIIKLCL